MLKQVNFQENVEALASDMMRVQELTRSTIDAVVGDFLQAAKTRYFGMTVTRATTTQVSMAPGRFYDVLGKGFGLDAALSIDLTPYLPAVGNKIVALAVYGEIRDENSLIRDFIDPQTEDAVPRQIYLEKARAVLVTIVAGAENASPIRPTIPAQYCGVAYVYLTPTGMLDQSAITMITENEVTSLDDVIVMLADQDREMRSLKLSIGALRTDFQVIRGLLLSTVGVEALGAVAREVAAIREDLGLPDSHSGAHADRFLTDDEADTAHIDYLAKIDEGLRFANANVHEQVPALLVANDAAVKVSPGGLLLPRYTEEVTLSIGDAATERDGEISMTTYQASAFTADLLTLTRNRIRFGEEYIASTSSRYWQAGLYDPAVKIFKKDGEVWGVQNPRMTGAQHRTIRMRRYFNDQWRQTYWANGATQKSVSGRAVCQTWAQQSTRWITGIDLRFTQLGTSGDVTVLACRVDRGAPVGGQIYAWVTLPVAELKTNAWTTFPLEPFVAAAGERVGFIVVTNGAHKLQVSTTNDYTQGTMFHYVDGTFAVAEASKDICFQLRAAKFAASRTEVALQPWTLDGGMSGVDIMVPSTQSDAALIKWQFNVGGVWHDAEKTAHDDAPTAFTGLPALVQARMVMNHTKDFAPGVRLADGIVRLTRPRTAGKFISAAWTTAAPITSLKAELVLADYDVAFHSITVSIRHGFGFNTVTPATTTSIRTRSDGLKVLTATWAGLSNLTTYKWQVDMTTSNALKPFLVEEISDFGL